MLENSGPKHLIHIFSRALMFSQDNWQKSLTEFTDKNEKDTGSIVFTGKMVSNDVRQIEKNQIAIKAQAVFYSLVSQQQKLCKAEQSKGQTSADAAFNGPQGRMASLKFLIISR